MSATPLAAAPKRTSAEVREAISRWLVLRRPRRTRGLSVSNRTPCEAWSWARTFLAKIEARIATFADQRRSLWAKSRLCKTYLISLRSETTLGCMRQLAGRLSVARNQCRPAGAGDLL